jgi:hypothetical protein
MDKFYLTPAEVEAVTGFDQQAIRTQASTKEGLDMFPFPVARFGSRTKILREPFISWCEGRLTR